ncbi:MAG TPA: DUF167 domain-containing protein [Myxococcales bacterium]|nr:DUF167 domain-containing protein [Myxococcales bacterium]
MPPPWLQPVEGGVELLVLVQPRASRSRVVGEHGGYLKVQLAAPPVDGAANAALLELLAELLGVPRRQVSLVSGESSRRKRVRAAGVDAPRAEAVMK